MTTCFFAVMCKSSVIIYILVFGIIFGLERFVSTDAGENGPGLRENSSCRLALVFGCRS